LNIQIHFKKTVILIVLVLGVMPLFLYGGEEEKNSTLRQCELIIVSKDAFATQQNRDSDYRPEDIKGKLEVEIAATFTERTYGLMNRKSLGKDNGMFFIHPKDEYLNYWMKNTYIPLSIAYIDRYGVIKDIQHMKPLDTTTSYLSRFPVRFALEVNEGWFTAHTISTGDKLVLNGCLGL
jgi:uncharacterized membrane protein (UPF0127 family)